MNWPVGKLLLNIFSENMRMSTFPRTYFVRLSDLFLKEVIIKWA